MRVRVYYDRRTLEHEPGPSYPESRGRLVTLFNELDNIDTPGVEVIHAGSPVKEKLLTRVHEPSYLERFKTHVQAGVSHLDTMDCPLSPATYDAALISAGLTVQAVQDAAGGSGLKTFAVVRPPGHHALQERAMGFCYFNNVALAAMSVLDSASIERVAVLDWDAHHGNGTQEIFYHRDDLLYVSLHGDPSITYPGTGRADETGAGEGEGCTRNFPQPAGVTSAGYLEEFDTRVIPLLESYKPDLIIVSCGYDGHEDDPLVPNLALDDAAFLHMVREVTALADEVSQGRLSLVLEGGYNPATIARLTLGAVELLMSAPRSSV